MSKVKLVLVFSAVVVAVFSASATAPMAVAEGAVNAELSTVYDDIPCCKKP